MASKNSCAQLIDALGSLGFAYRKLRRTHVEQRAALQILGVIAKHGDIRVSDLAQELQVAPSTVSRQVDELVDESFVQRVAVNSDGRASFLRATETGMQLLGQLRDHAADDLTRCLTDWADDDVQQLAHHLAHLEKSLYESTQNPAKVR